jgi:hypothetical protein
MERTTNLEFFENHYETSDVILKRVDFGLKKTYNDLLYIRYELKRLDDSLINVENNENLNEFFNKLSINKRSPIKQRIAASIFIYHILCNYRG